MQKKHVITNVLSMSVFLLIVNFLSTDYALADRRDGNFWLNLPESAKITYMVGFFDGMGLGFKFSHWGFDDEANTACLQKTYISYNIHVDKYLANVTGEQLVDGLNSFYSDFKNRTILIHNGVWLVLNQIVGTDNKEYERMLENFRKYANSQ